jgi:hypothetical protein
MVSSLSGHHRQLLSLSIEKKAYGYFSGKPVCEKRNRQLERCAVLDQHCDVCAARTHSSISSHVTASHSVCG